QREGHWITAAGIAGPARSLLIDNRSGKQEVREGSLFDAPEYYSGFWLIEANDEAKAKELALAGSLACNRKVELRPYL
ncbi:MAG: YciI family protein, partial [Actinomycetota bacterium]